MRYIIGIDLGTTNSAVSFVDTKDPKLAVQLFQIPQIIGEGHIAPYSTLPSFCYLPSSDEKLAIQMPWPTDSVFVGKYAQEQGARVPTRLVMSAKSWLCHSAANRKDKILPVDAANPADRMSPVHASSLYLQHIRNAWNHYIARRDPDAEFDQQEIILTVPASFDEVARTLTVDAAKQAGYSQITLLEEPQAAFYSWIASKEGQWESLIPENALILVCDVGGGTTDFSLIQAKRKEGKAAFDRIAVGNHLLLGGDNMDIAILHYLEEKIHATGKEITNTQRLQLLHESRRCKEELLGGQLESCRIVLQGSGSSVVQGSLSVEISLKEVYQLLVEGFFGSYAFQEASVIRKNQGIRTMGLPYESEPSITNHCAHFLKESGKEGSPLAPDFVLFNGGAMKPAVFQQALLNSLKQWFPNKNIQALPSHHLDLAVSRGASYYGKARRGMGIKIGGGVPRSYYLIIDVKDSSNAIHKKALTVLEKGSEEGAQFEPEQTFQLMPNTPVSFTIASSHTRGEDRLGDLIEIDEEEIHLLPPIHTVLQYGKSGASEDKIPVHLTMCYTPIGTLEVGLKAVNTSHRWKLEFQLKTATGQEQTITAERNAVDRIYNEEELSKAEAVVDRVFGERKGEIKPDKLMAHLESVLGIPKQDWSTGVMRKLADATLKHSSGRKLSEVYGERWWNFIGFLLRPGFGYPLDDFRIKELWKLVLGDSRELRSTLIQTQMWICYRRIAGGLSRGQQVQIGQELFPLLLNKQTGKIQLKNKSELNTYAEQIRTFAALELLDVGLKIKMGNALVERIISGEGGSADYWALGRLGARHMMHASLPYVVPAKECERWIEALLKSSCRTDKHGVFLFSQLARKTGEKSINLSKAVVKKVLEKFQTTSDYERLSEILLTETTLTHQEEEQLFGERLPAGLLLDV